MELKEKNNDKLRYSEEDLREFEKLINDKLAKSREELVSLKDSMKQKHGASGVTFKLIEDNADSMEKEHLTKLAARMQKFISQLENALIRIKNGTYGICIDTGKLIPKERLRAVPHTQHTIEAKIGKK